jgi:hypothetical protein
MAQCNNISIFVNSQVPDFWNRDAGELVNFIQLYYEWAEQFENPIVISRKLSEYKDVDLIPDQYLKFMRNEFMKSIPVTKVDDRLLMKNILDFYRARGTEKAYKMLFRILYGDENVSFYYPGKDILRASDGKWVIERSLKLNLTADQNIVEGLIVVRGETSGATARKDKFLSYVISEVKTDELYINNIFGDFRIGEELIDDTTGEKIGTIIDFVTYPGSWVGTDGFLSSDKKLEDNFFYQEYSYQIRSSHALAEYENIANQLTHPAGTKLFGAVDMFELADFSDLTLSLVSNLGNVGDVSKISIPYELIIPEQSNLGAVSNTAPRVWTTQTGTQDTQSGDFLSTWLSYSPFDETFADFTVSDLSKNIIFRSDVPSFTISDWTPFKIIDSGNSANTYVFPQKVVNTTIMMLSKEYIYGQANNLHYQTYAVPTSGGTGWLPSGATDYLDFVAHHYYAGGTSVTASSVLGGPYSFNASTAIDGTGLTPSATQLPDMVSSLLSDMISQVTNGCTILLDIEYTAFPNSPVLDMFEGTDSSSSTEYVQTWLNSSGLQLYDNNTLSETLSTGWYVGKLPGIVQTGPHHIGLTINRNVGGGNREYSVAVNGTGLYTQQVNYTPIPSGISHIALGHYDDTNWIDGKILKMTVLPPMSANNLLAATDIYEYPIIYSLNNKYDNTPSTSHAIAMPTDIPTGSNPGHDMSMPNGIVPVGSMLLVLVSFAGTPTVTIGSGTGWTLGTPVAVGSDLTAVYAWKIATGSDALTLNTSTSVKHTQYALCIKNATTLEVAHSTGVAAINGDPPSITPSGGLGNYLWLATRHASGSTTAFTLPTNMDSAQIYQDGDSTNCTTQIVQARSTASSFNPNTYTTAFTSDWCCFTFAIKG